MASIHKIGRSRFWYMSYRDADGNQHFKSTKIERSPLAPPKEAALKASEHKRLAMEMALKLEEQERGNPTEIHLRKVVSDISQRVNKRHIEFASVESHFNSWLSRVEKSKSPATHVRYKGAAEAFFESLGAKAKAALSDITPKDVEKFIEHRQVSGKNATTIDTDLKALNRPFALALRQGLILTNPVPAADRPTGAKESKDPFTWEQVAALVRNAKGEWKTAIMIGAYTSARLGDAASMRSGYFDFEKGQLRYTPQKTRGKKKELIVPLHPHLEAYLLKLPEIQTDNGFLCPDLSKVKVGGRRGLSRQFQAIMERADIEQVAVAPNKTGGRTFNKFGFHSLRHSFNSELANANVAPDIRKLFTGHQNDRVHSIYTHHKIETMRRELERALPQLR
jgi:integrase